MTADFLEDIVATDLAQAKSEAARDYVHGLEALKSNAIALARWAPGSVDRLRKAQARLSDALTVNMTVLATARSVSESIVRTLATGIYTDSNLATATITVLPANAAPSTSISAGSSSVAYGSSMTIDFCWTICGG